MNPPGQRYNKPALDENELIERYIERGLIIKDRNRAARYLRHIGYYRLSPYTIPFQADRTTHSFKSGTTFDDILYIYVFDRQLRLMTMDALERVEVAVRAAVSNTMSIHGEGGAFWYQNASNYKSRKDTPQRLNASSTSQNANDSALLQVAANRRITSTTLMPSRTTSPPTRLQRHHRLGWSSSCSPPASFITFTPT